MTRTPLRARGGPDRPTGVWKGRDGVRHRPASAAATVQDFCVPVGRLLPSSSTTNSTVGIPAAQQSQHTSHSTSQDFYTPQQQQQQSKRRSTMSSGSGVGGPPSNNMPPPSQLVGPGTGTSPGKFSRNIPLTLRPHGCTERGSPFHGSTLTRSPLTRRSPTFVAQNIQHGASEFISGTSLRARTRHHFEQRARRPARPSNGPPPPCINPGRSACARAWFFKHAQAASFSNSPSVIVLAQWGSISTIQQRSRYPAQRH